MNDLDLDKCRRHLLSSTPLIAGWLQDRAIQSLTEDASAEAVRLLEEAVTDFVDDDRGDAAFSAIARLAEAGNTPAQEALCRLVVHHAHAASLREVAARGYLPHEERQRAVFYFLVGRWKEYDAARFRPPPAPRSLSIRRSCLIAWQLRRARRPSGVGRCCGRRQARQTSRPDDRCRMVRRAHRARSQRMLERSLAPGSGRAPTLVRCHLRLCPPSKVTDPDRQGLKDLFKLAENWPPDDFAQTYYHRATLFGHEHEVRCLAIDSSDRILASGSADRTVRLWNLETGQALATCTGHRDWVNALGFVADRNLFVSAGRDGRLFSWAGAHRTSAAQATPPPPAPSA